MTGDDVLAGLRLWGQQMQTTEAEAVAFHQGGTTMDAGMISLGLTLTIASAETKALHAAGFRGIRLLWCDLRGVDLEKPSIPGGGQRH